MDNQKKQAPEFPNVLADHKGRMTRDAFEKLLYEVRCDGVSGFNSCSNPKKTIAFNVGEMTATLQKTIAKHRRDLCAGVAAHTKALDAKDAKIAYARATIANRDKTIAAVRESYANLNEAHNERGISNSDYANKAVTAERERKAQEEANRRLGDVIALRDMEIVRLTAARNILHDVIDGAMA